MYNQTAHLFIYYLFYKYNHYLLRNSMLKAAIVYFELILMVIMGKCQDKILNWSAGHVTSWW